MDGDGVGNEKAVGLIGNGDLVRPGHSGSEASGSYGIVPVIRIKTGGCAEACGIIGANAVAFGSDGNRTYDGGKNSDRGGGTALKGVGDGNGIGAGGEIREVGSLSAIAPGKGKGTVADAGACVGITVIVSAGGIDFFHGRADVGRLSDEDRRGRGAAIGTGGDNVIDSRGVNRYRGGCLVVIPKIGISAGRSEGYNARGAG